MKPAGERVTVYVSGRVVTLFKIIVVVNKMWVLNAQRDFLLELKLPRVPPG